MFFSNTEKTFRIINIIEINCIGRNVNVAPRPFHALSFRFKGGAVFTDDSRSIACKNGDLVYVPNGVHYELHYPNKEVEEHMIVIHFECPIEHDDCFHIFTPKNIEVFANLFSRLYSTWRLEQHSTIWDSMSCFYEILSNMAKQFFVNEVTTEEKRIRQAVNYLQAHFTDSNLTVEKLCEISMLCDTQFRKLFKRVYHTTPLKYLNFLRVEHAASLLRDPILKVEEICGLSGFTDAKYFSTVFKKYNGLSPAQYRKQL